MASKKDEEVLNERLIPVEELGKNLPAWLMVGVKTRHKWGSGKAMTEKEFKAAVDGFLNGSMKGVK
jgi:hypothetical protein